ncbi:DNA primase [Candidatus Phytoplasma solani]|nr:DNA primase [Candidatus Phytoplasma solani]
MQKQLIKDVNKQTSIVELVQEFVQLKKSGKNYMGLCPFHEEKSPSFSVSPEKNIAVCMSCKKGGDPIFFYKSIKNISFNEALNHLAARLGLTSLLLTKSTHKYAHLHKIMQETQDFFCHQLKHNKQALEYLTKRGLDEATIAHFKLGYAPKFSLLSRFLTEETKFSYQDLKTLSLVNQNEETGKYYDFFQSRLIFPITSPHGQVIAFSSRSLGDQTPKYLNSPETVLFKKGEVLYQFFENQAEIKKKETIILHEGFFDVIASFQAGVKNVVATMGTNLTEKHITLLKKLTNQIVIAYDGDTAGKKAALEVGSTLHKHQMDVKILELPDKLDPDEYIQIQGASKYRQLLTDHIKAFLTLKIDLICQKLNFNNRKKIENELKALLQGADFASKMVYQEYLQTKYQLFINLTINETIASVPTPTQNHINYKKFDFETHVLIEFINNRSFFEKNYQTFDDASIYSDLAVIYFVAKIKEYYNKNPHLQAIPWSYFESKSHNEATNVLLSEIKNHHFFKNKTLLEQTFFEQELQMKKINKKIQELQEAIDRLKISLKPLIELKKKEKKELAEKIINLQKQLKRIKQQRLDVINGKFNYLLMLEIENKI